MKDHFKIPLFFFLIFLISIPCLAQHNSSIHSNVRNKIRLHQMTRSGSNKCITIYRDAEFLNASFESEIYPDNTISIQIVEANSNNICYENCFNTLEQPEWSMDISFLKNRMRYSIIVSTQFGKYIGFFSK